MTDPAEALLQLARTERRVAAEGRIDQLVALHDERDRLIAALPARPAPHQVPKLRQALALQAEVAQVLARTRDVVGAELARVDHGRETLRGYAPAGLEAPRSFDATG